ncbi:MAG: NAD(P)/FAD-dependent oxidoreductase, partial [Elusimicrobiaceae bacterium]|nr:NAD(P)/FAD-dependent oxidoreductase [Elusimicrobiaceae bacterium]
ETSSRNSEVIHAGIYYAPGSLKAGCCVRGRRLLYKYCEEHAIPCSRTGKLIVAFEEAELAGLAGYEALGRANGVDDLQRLDPEQIHSLEPEVHGLAGLLSPSTGIFSADLFMDSLLKTAETNEAIFLPRSAVTGLKKTPDGFIVTADNQDPFETRVFINCAGHGAPAVARLAGIDPDASGYRQRMIKGEYFRVRGGIKISRLLYPMPNELSLGMHLTPDLEGGVRIGPSAFEVPVIDYRVNELNRSAFFDGARRFLPGVTHDSLVPDTAGIRPRLACYPGTAPDFIIRREADKGLPDMINLIGIDSPGLTSSLAIAEHIQRLVNEILKPAIAQEAE